MSKKRPSTNPQPDASMEEAQETHAHALHPHDVMRNAYPTSVLSGRMTPEFATDQAEAAIRAMCDEGEKTEEK